MTQRDEIGLVWFRRDLRLSDNPAWAEATSTCRWVVPLFVVDPALLGSVGPFRRRQLIANLQALDFDLFEATGGRLLVRFGDPRVLVPEAVGALNVARLFRNEDASPFGRARDAAVDAAVDIPVHGWWGNLVHEPGTVLTKSGSVARVFTPFHKTWAVTERTPWPAPGDAVVFDEPGEPLPRLDEPPPFFEGESEALKRLEAFLTRVDDYAETRDRPDLDGTSDLSADLRFGTISARQVADAVGDASPGRAAFVRQLAWRDWYAHTMVEHPEMGRTELNPKYAAVAWRDAPGDLARWKGGYTGYPIVDAAMRELRETGRMHNRLRMVTASFLVKDLLIDWRLGEAHFRHLLVDYDPSQNVGNWQWVAGTGPDAAPYHRVFNPVVQSRKFDPDGTYIRRWLPELAALQSDALHAPWEAAPLDLEAAGITLGREYPEPVVDHAEGRDRFIEAYKAAAATDD